MTIDCRLDDFAIPGLPTYANQFGTKKQGGVGLSTAECVTDMMMPFMRQRPYVVTESSDTTEIQANSVFKVTATGNEETGLVTLTLEDAAYDGCEVTVVNSSQMYCIVNAKTSGLNGMSDGDVVVPPSDIMRLVFVGGWWSIGNAARSINRKINPELWENLEPRIVPLSSLIGPGIVSGFYTLEDIKGIVSRHAWPDGAIYTQYPGQKPPSELYGGTWENISSQYAGAFFRAEGGNAQGFDNQTAAQGESLKSHTHTISHTHTRGSMNITGGARSAMTDYGSNYGALSISGDSHSARHGSGAGFGGTQLTLNAANGWSGSTSAPSSANSGGTGGTETRPANWTIRIWKRTA